jgi:hypothetical protein
MKHWIARMSVALVIGFAAVVLWLPQTASAGTCSGTGCNGQDPSATGCTSGAVQIASNTGSINLRLYRAFSCDRNPNFVYYSNLTGGNGYSPQYVATEGQFVNGGRNLGGSNGNSKLWSYAIASNKRGYGTYTYLGVGYSIYTQWVSSS